MRGRESQHYIEQFFRSRVVGVKRKGPPQFELRQIVLTGRSQGEAQIGSIGCVTRQQQNSLFQRDRR